MKIAGSAEYPLWYKDAIIYELHVRTFCDANSDGIGDFPGLISKLDYLQDLGVTCLWLLPFFPSPLRDDGYDISDYRSVHPSYGTLEDFKKFLNEAHARNLQVMIELVVNHTSDQHPWFQAARAAPAGSAERNFYVWSDTDRKYSDARIIFTDTEKSNWTWDSVANAYYWHRFFSHQPDLNYDSPAVLEEICNIMAFWLELGVDGLRLDAIPYLVERDGSTCENLPETHAVVKHIRGKLDQQFSNRMILAEANQWPTDVRAYFGDGDECHMAFHFPLMPRLFMALRLEDRHPITDILAQTPDIPENCQWGLFLRNHDELTLEMVTDEERDYMYLAYSADPKMRINIGIRRRLAPLMENNRRRIELLNSLLFSFPGTPILYYGDELGMGDNIYLGDRNGVRTPMQWNADRNAGFSRATPTRLYSPVIMDPVYGYEAINVEAQQSDPSSLLTWMRHMIALRKLFKVFGRGSIEFFGPANRKVLAYVRRYEDEQVLCVANLSRFAQPAELDLSTLAGLTPIEMLGYVEFPRITRNPYTLTLGPYDFLWFELHGTVEPVQVPETADQSLTVAAFDWERILEGVSRIAMETAVLPKFLPAQRWFGSKSNKIDSVRVKDWTQLKGTSAALMLVDVRYVSAPPETYFIPLSLAAAEAAVSIRESAPENVLCAMRAGTETGLIYDAAADPQACRALLSALRRMAELPARTGVFRFSAGSALGESGESDDGLAIRRLSGEQSNSSILYGDRFILKLFRKVVPGTNPDCEVSRYLSEQVGFDGIPAYGGAIDYYTDSIVPMTAGMLQEFVASQGDGWQWTLDELGRHYEQCVANDHEPAVTRGAQSLLELSGEEVPESMRAELGIYCDTARNLGRRTAQLHLALASPTHDPGFAPEPFDSGDLQRLSADMKLHAESAFDALRESLPRLPDEVMEKASLVVSLRRKVLAHLKELAALDVSCSKIRIHGDYHLGQVLRLDNDFRILDFEGEPARPLAERRNKQSALKDVAGMLRSFGYAAHAALFSYLARRPDTAEQLERWAVSWELSASVTFLNAYRTTAADASFLPSDADSFRRLLEVFLLDKALYELRYEINNRPAWVMIPLHGILSLGLGGKSGMLN